MNQSEDLDVTVIGNIGFDTNVYFHGDRIDFEVEANFTDNLDCIGQAGGYASRGYRNLGKNTAFIGYIGADLFGQHILDTFQEENIDSSGVFIDPDGTSRSINLMFHNGTRKNFYDGKGHMHLRPNLDTCSQILARSKLAHFNIPHWARLLLPIARQMQVKIACDIQDVVDIADPYRQDFIRVADYLFFSSVNHTDVKPILRKLMTLRPEAVIVCGMGENGCALAAHQEIRFFSPVQMEKPVIDTNGAGDSLAVGLLTSYVLDGYSLEDSILRGQISARHACTLKSDSSQLITRPVLDHYYSILKNN
ncbi:MAG TPA: carbohydrate kinase family protein [Anaerolineales bacterium]|nr:carbohydrate kinase family protein [Anaerolineales bacterium]